MHAVQCTNAKDQERHAKLLKGRNFCEYNLSIFFLSSSAWRLSNELTDTVYSIYITVVIFLDFVYKIAG
jgi:hypothetical protein